MSAKTKLIVNFFGTPGRGKSTMAARLFADLKMNDVDVELVREYAKELVWAGEDLNSMTQLEITGEQIRREVVLLDQVEVIVTDSPILMGLLYAPNDSIARSYITNHRTATQPYASFNVLMEKSPTFNPNGRVHSEAQSDALSQTLQQILTDHRVTYITTTKTQSEALLRCVLEILQNLKHPDDSNGTDAPYDTDEILELYTQAAQKRGW